MPSVTDLKKILAIEGVSQYILLGPDGQAIAHNVENHLILTSLIISCTSICKLINGNQFRHLIFSQEDNRDFFIFPVGKYYLGVIKSGDCDAESLPIKVSNFITELARK
jgi:hypothetical protein